MSQDKAQYGNSDAEDVSTYQEDNCSEGEMKLEDLGEPTLSRQEVNSSLLQKEDEATQNDVDHVDTLKVFEGRTFSVRHMPVQEVHHWEHMLKAFGGSVTSKSAIPHFVVVPHGAEQTSDSEVATVVTPFWLEYCMQVTTAPSEAIFVAAFHSCFVLAEEVCLVALMQPVPR